MCIEQFSSLYFQYFAHVVLFIAVGKKLKWCGKPTDTRVQNNRCEANWNSHFDTPTDYTASIK
jgi:hypothetical protein